MAFRVVLDARVLYPFSLRDAVLRLAEVELYAPFWSGRILAEMTRNLVANGLMPRSQADRLARLMRKAFAYAEVPAGAVEQLEPAMTNHPQDRHVLAAAVAAHAGAIVTVNLKDFRPRDCAPLGVEAIHPDDFLSALLAKAPATVVTVLRQQAADLNNPPIQFEDLLQMLTRSAPSSVAGIRAQE